MREVRLKPSFLASKVSDYFATTTDKETTLCAPDIGPCIGALVYRQGHLGLGHFDPFIELVMPHLKDRVMPEMQKEGEGDIGCRLYTGQSFMAREEYRGPNIVKFIEAERGISEMGFKYTGMEDSRILMLANNGPGLAIKELQARLTGDDLDLVRVLIQYIGKDASNELEYPTEEFEIDTKSHQTRVVQPFSGTDFSQTRGFR